MSDEMRATAGSWWKEPQPTICPNSDCVRLGSELAQARQQIEELTKKCENLLFLENQFKAERDSACNKLELLNEFYTVDDEEPNDIFLGRIAEWLKANEKRASDARYGRFPLGFVQRWIERAESVEQQLAEARAALKQVANCSCEEGHTCVRVAREIAQKALEPK